PISLQPTGHDCKSEYEKNRLDRPFISKGNHTIDGVTIQLFEHPVTHVQSVTLISGIPEESATKINGELKKETADLQEQWIACSDWEGGVTASWISHVWMVFDSGYGGFCGGPHPNEVSHLISYDSNTGERIDFSTWIDPENFHEAPRGKVWKI